MIQASMNQARPKSVKVIPVKRRNFSARGDRFKHVPAVLALIAGGMSVQAACRSDRRFPTPAQFNSRLRNDPDLRARFDAVCPRAGQSCPNLAALEHGDAILTLIEDGMSLRRACASDPRFPNRHAFVGALRYAPDLELRYDLAMVRRKRPHAKAIAAFDEIERRIVAGGAIYDILNSDRARFPAYEQFRRFLKSSPDHDARYRAAGRARQAGPNALRQGPAYSATELRRATTALMLSDARAEIHTSRLSPGGIHVQTLLRARFRCPDLLVAVESAVVARRTRLHLVTGRPKISPANVRLIAPTPKIIRPDPSARLVSSLSQNEVWRLALNAIPTNIDPDTRNDVAADLVVAVLEGRIGAHEIQDRVGEFKTAHYRKITSRQNTGSLDEPLYSDSTLTRGETITIGWD